MDERTSAYSTGYNSDIVERDYERSDAAEHVGDAAARNDDRRCDAEAER
jgi:hypothetical protein